MTVLGRDINKDGRPDQFIYTLRESRRSPFIAVDTTLKGQLDSFIWIYQTKDSGPTPEILHEENLRPETRERTWYGPGSRKLLSKQDLDRNGSLETTVYYNRTALPGVLVGTVARLSVDASGDGKPDVWIYPRRRLELASRSGGPPDLMTADLQLILAAFKAIRDGKPPTKSGLAPLSPTQSWVLRPENIREERFRAVIEREY